jgi:hypothetical protein
MLVTFGWGDYGLIVNGLLDYLEQTVNPICQIEPPPNLLTLTYFEAKLNILETMINELLMSIPALATKKELSHVIEVSWAPLETMTTTVSNLEDRVRILLRNSSN